MLKCLLYFQVLLVYPPDKQPPIKYKDLHSFCFPGGIEVLYSFRMHMLSHSSELKFPHNHCLVLAYGELVIIILLLLLVSAYDTSLVLTRHFGFTHF